MEPADGAGAAISERQRQLVLGATKQVAFGPVPGAEIAAARSIAAGGQVGGENANYTSAALRWKGRHLELGGHRRILCKCTSTRLLRSSFFHSPTSDLHLRPQLKLNMGLS